METCTCLAGLATVTTAATWMAFTLFSGCEKLPSKTDSVPNTIRAAVAQEVEQAVYQSEQQWMDSPATPVYMLKYFG